MKAVLKELEKSYRPSILWQGGHIATIGTHLIRSSDFSFSKTEHLDTPDGDVLRIESRLTGKRDAVVILHGLEGSSERPYVRNMAGTAVALGLDVVALNFRSCGGLMNKKARFYHSGETGDFCFLIDHLRSVKKIDNIIGVGFSLGGNVLLKYLGERGAEKNSGLIAALAISVPLDLRTSALRIEKWDNFLYMRRFLKSLKEKVRAKMDAFPQAADWKRGLKAKTFHEFDDAVTAPLHGFDGVLDYYEKSSSRSYLDKISIPTLILNARNDPFLSRDCYPEEGNSPSLITMYPNFGGHVGFPLNSPGEKNLAERVLSIMVGELTLEGTISIR